VKCETSIMVGNRKRFRGKIVEPPIRMVSRSSATRFPKAKNSRSSFPFTALADAKLILTDDLIRDALRADKLAKAEAANQNEAEDEE
jgi:ribosome maturation factor RimP